MVPVLKTSTQDTSPDSNASVHINTAEYAPALVSVVKLIKISDTYFLAITDAN